MNWRCPHCGISLAISDEALGTGWSFSKCYKCGGFALIRRTEINIIKVDKAPPGERVILPEAGNEPLQGLMGRNATQKMNKHLNEKNQKTAPPPFHSAHGTQRTFDISTAALPEPLPEVPDGKAVSSSSLFKKMNGIPKSIAFTGLLTIASGSYLVFQGNILWKKLHDLPTIDIHEKPLAKAAKDVVSPPSLLTAESTEAPAANPVITDQVQKSAMAPLKIALPSEADHSEPFTVRIRTPKANIHSGPGMEYPIVGTAVSELTYSVSEWKDRWFKLKVRNSPESGNTGWVRNDLVQILDSTALPQLNPSHQ